MKYILLKFFPVWVLGCLLLSCAKQNTVHPATANLTLINAVAGSAPSLVPNFSGTTDPITWYNTAFKLVYGTATSAYQLSSYSGEQKLAIYHFPDTLAHSTPLFNLTLDLPAGSIHTLFLTGTMTAPDTLFTTDMPPYHPPSDSSLGIRFVNLSPGSAPVSVNITGNANGSEVSSLSYKGLTSFKNYPATAGVSSYTFEFHDVATGTPIATYTVSGIADVANTSNIRRYRNVTIALLGQVGNTTAPPKIILIDTYTSF